MRNTLTPFRVFVASPSDLTAERSRLKELEKELRDDAEHARYSLRICDWRDAGPGAGRPQGVIFSQLPPEEWDVFVGLLWQRFGTPSGAANPVTGEPFESGTEEEFYETFRLHREYDGRPYVLPYRCMRPISPTADVEQLGAVQKFFKQFDAGQPSQALIGQFVDADELVKKVSADLRRLFREAVGESPVPHMIVPCGILDDSAYRAHIRKHYRLLHLEALGGSDPVYRNIELQHIFIPQDARDCREWLPENLEGPADLTLKAAADLHLAELHDQQRFHNTAPRPVIALLDDPSVRCRVVLGAPGAGKSSLAHIRLLDWEKAGAARSLPVLIELRLFYRSGHTDFLDYLENGQDVVFHFPREALHARLISGSAEMIFDGLDEIFEPAERDTAVRLIASYAETYPQARILVTSRLIGYHGHILRDAGFAHWLLADFDEKKIAAFLDHWTTDAVREPADRPVVRQRMEDALHSAVIRELAGNPLLLTLMAVLARKSELPRDLSSLYDEAADLLLKQWDTHRMLASDVEFGGVIIDHKDKHDLLRDLAWDMQTGQRGLRGNLISKKEVDNAMDKAFVHRIPDPGTRRKAISLLIDKLIERNYILCHVGGAQFAFVHRGFLEFFASERLIYMVSKTPQTAVAEIAEIYREHAWDDAWRQVLILAATRFASTVADQILFPLTQEADAKAVATAACYAETHPFILVVDALAAARVPSKIEKTSAYVRTTLEGWIRYQAQFIDGDGWINLLIKNFRDERTRDLLMDIATQDELTFTRLGAILCLAESFHDNGHTRKLLFDLARREEKSDARDPRQLAIACLAKYFGEKARQELINMGFDEEVSAAPTTLAEYFGPVATQARLAQMARTVEDSETRSQAVEALAKRYPNSAAFAVIAELARSDENTAARSQAVGSLAEHFRGTPEMAETMRIVAESAHGKAVLGKAANLFQADTKVRTYLLSFLKPSTQGAKPRLPPEKCRRDQGASL